MVVTMRHLARTVPRRYSWRMSCFVIGGTGTVGSLVAFVAEHVASWSKEGPLAGSSEAR